MSYYPKYCMPRCSANVMCAVAFSMCGWTKSQAISTFSMPFGQYGGLRMSFGISPASDNFQRLIEQHLKRLKGVKTYMTISKFWEVEQKKEKKHKTMMNACVDCYNAVKKGTCRISIQRNLPSSNDHYCAWDIYLATAIEH